MSVDQITYLVFGVVLVLALLFDLGLLSKKDQDVTIKKALNQTFFWVGLALAFFFFVWYEKGQSTALEYLSAYLMEWSLSIDNIFVFILIFAAFSVAPKNYGRVLLIGILMAIVFRILFITVGVALVDRFHWILYVFGVFLVYTGYKMFTATEDEEFNPQQSKIYLFLKKFLPLVPHDGGGKFMIRENGRPVYTTLFVVVIMLAAIDLVFALDSIPAILGLTTSSYVVITANIFALMGLRQLYFLLQGAMDRLVHLGRGLSFILAFIGVKMILHALHENGVKVPDISLEVSLTVIVSTLAITALTSLYATRGQEVLKK